MDDRWAYPILMTMQRQAGSVPKPRSAKSPPVAPAAANDEATLKTSDAEGASAGR